MMWMCKVDNVIKDTSSEEDTRSREIARIVEKERRIQRYKEENTGI